MHMHVYLYVVPKICFVPKIVVPKICLNRVYAVSLMQANVNLAVRLGHIYCRVVRHTVS